jgi:predicted nucleotidyltransferase
VPGTESNQVRLLLEKAFEKESSVVLGGSRVRGTYQVTSDLDVGFNNLTANQAAKLTKKISEVGPLQLEEKIRIVSGNTPRNVPKIVSPEEFFQRVGRRVAVDEKAGQVFLPSGSLTVTPGKVTFIPPGIRP